MAKFNKKATTAHIEKKLDEPEHRLAGGYGVFAAKQSPYQQLRRCTLACMLGEDIAYANGRAVMDDIKELVPQVEPQQVADLAVEIRLKQKIRHTSLFLAREMARHKTHRYLVGGVLKQIVKRPDDLTDFMAMYWSDGKVPIASQIKKASSDIFAKWGGYQLQKYNRDTEIRLRDVLLLLHPKPKGGVAGRNKTWRKSHNDPELNPSEVLFDQLVRDDLDVPDTWEVALSAGKDKKTEWERLVSEKSLGALAFLRNLRNMRDVGVSLSLIQEGLSNLRPDWLLPLNFYAAWKECPDLQRSLDLLMQKCYGLYPKLSGTSVIIIDVSGSTNANVAGKSQFSRKDVEIALLVMAVALSENAIVYVTAGDDNRRRHATEKISPTSSFGIVKEINATGMRVGGGGIFTRQVLEFVEKDLRGEIPDRIIVLSDSQDCDAPELRIPKPFGKYNYLVDISANRRGIGYDGLWTAEILGVSEATIHYIAELESQLGQ